MYRSSERPHRAPGAARLISVVGAAALAVTLAATPAAAGPERPADRPAASPERLLAEQPLPRDGISVKPAYDLGDDHDPRVTIAQAYLQSYPRLTEEQAWRAALAQPTAVPIKDALQWHWETFGGGWFDPHTATYHLAVTDPDTAAHLEKLPEVGENPAVAVAPFLVERSLDQLERTADSLRYGDGKLAELVGEQVGVDVTSNEVVAAVPEDRYKEALTLPRPDEVRLVVQERLDIELDSCNSRIDCPEYIASGLAIRDESTGCSGGFTAHNLYFGARVQLTAGHCTEDFGGQWQNGLVAPEYIGPVTDKIDEGPADVSRIVIHSSSVYHDQDRSGRIAIGPSSWVPVTDDTFLLDGDVVCLSANYQDPTRSGNPCGVVQDTSDPNVRGMVRISGYDACNGDSGGGWYWFAGGSERQAAALHSRSLAGCNAEGALSWASPLTAFWDGLLYDSTRLWG